MLLDAALMAVLALWLRRSRSRLPAVLLLLWGVVTFALTLTNLLGVTHFNGGRNVIIAGLLVWLGLRSIAASRTLAGVESP